MQTQQLVDILKRIPNSLTFLRLALIPVFVLLLINPSQWMIDAAVVVFFIAAITDLLDGALARRLGVVSDFGKLFDPLADKILVLSALIMLVSLRDVETGDPWVPGWMVFLVVAREVWVTGLRGVGASHGIVVPANSTAKWKSLFQMAAVIFLLLHNSTLTVWGLTISCSSIGLNLLLISLIFSLVSAVEYTTKVLLPRDPG